MQFGTITELGIHLDDLADNLSWWSQKTFGADDERGPIGPLKHLEQEAREAQASPDDVMEHADCLILVLDAARRAGFSTMRLLLAAEAKLKVNMERQWPTPTSDEPVQHVKTVEEVSP